MPPVDRVGWAVVGAFALLTALAVGALLVGQAPATGLEAELTRIARRWPDVVADGLWIPMQAGTVPVALVLAGGIGIGRGWRAGARAAAAVGLVWLTSRRIKAAVDRPRLRAEELGAVPREVVESAAYPSSHAAVAFALATSIALVDRRWGRVAFAVAGLVALGRVVAGVHTVADLAGGAALGAAAALLVDALDRVVDVAAARRGRPAERPPSGA